MRIAIVGSAGSGKSTLAAALSARLHAPLVELDELYWRPGWQATPIDEFEDKVMAALSAPAWIVCGNYSSVRPLVWGQADTLVWLDYSFPLSFYRLCLRTWRRIVTQEELWGGNRESWRAQLLSRDSLLLYALRTHRRRRVEFALTLGEAEYAHLTVHRFRHPAQAEAWAAGIV